MSQFTATKDQKVEKCILAWTRKKKAKKAAELCQQRWLWPQRQSCASCWDDLYPPRSAAGVEGEEGAHSHPGCVPHLQIWKPLAPKQGSVCSFQKLPLLKYSPKCSIKTTY